MKSEEKTEILKRLDLERQTVVYPGTARYVDSGVIRDVSADGKNGEIVYSACTEAEMDGVIKQQQKLAVNAGYALEWKVYGHDQPQCLGERLAAAGFEAGDREAFMVFQATPESLNRFGVCHADIRRVTDTNGLTDYRKIIEEVRGRNCEKESAQYGFLLENHPYHMSLYIAYVDDEPAACGRIYFHTESRFAGLYGGNTRERFRKRGLFTQVVAARLREAFGRGVVSVYVDALPTSEPILAKRGFERVTWTQPFGFAGS